MSIDAWAKVSEAVAQADSITWDGCHKIYVLMDVCQTAEMKEHGYDPLYKIKDIGQYKALQYLRKWYSSSCGLRFINSVRTVTGNPNEGFSNLIAQFEDIDS